MWVGAAIRAAGRTPGGKPGRRGPRRPISSGPKTGRKPRKLTTSEAAIRRFEARKRGGTGRTPTRKPWGRSIAGPSRPTGTGRNRGKIGGRGIRRTRTTSTGRRGARGQGRRGRR